ncbi:MAG TPA: NAD(P)/FAD-dependent oxidoreductase [Jatrophihabitantaceae bacterium]|nr:NAD(P)/FAD-dependent oxidoreductase [Jatrophihabitantaceae bacterium]
MTDSDFDLIVLGLGPGGEEVAESAARAGRRVLGIDPALVGGECPYYGCIPSKMILRGAQVLTEARRVDVLAGHAETRPDFTPVAIRIRDEATDDWDDRVAVERLEKLGGVFVRGAGRLAGRDADGRLIVTVGEQAFRAPDVVVATGTAPAIPPVTGLAELRASGSGVDGPVWTNREAVKAREAPASLVVIGGGAIGCELAQGFARFGSAVTVIEAAERLLMPEEPEASQTIAEVFAREGITVRTGVGVAQVAASGDGVQVSLENGGTATGTKLLVAAGRRPNLGDIGLDSVGLDDQSRALDVDEHMQVLRDGEPVGGLYAVGDITGRGQFTHVAVWQARVLLAHLAGEQRPFGGYHGLAWATFTDPEVGRVGLTEQQARKDGRGVRVASAPVPANTRGWIYGPGNDGFVKLVADGDVLVGATVVAPNGGEILGLLTLAVHARVPVETLRTMHYAFPTMHRTVLEALQNLE